MGESVTLNEQADPRTERVVGVTDGWMLCPPPAAGRIEGGLLPFDSA
jgi:hypothetical protein